MVKRVSFVTHESPSVEEEARIRNRHQGLLHDYLDLQKDFVTEKKRLSAVKRKREILTAEVRFLSQRHAHLLKVRASKTETPIFQHQNPIVQPDNSARERNGLKFSVNSESKSNGGEKAAGESVSILKKPKNRGVKAISETKRVQKKPENGSIKRMTIGKKKLPVPDQVFFLEV